MYTWKVNFSGTGILLMSVISTALGLIVSIPQSNYEVARGDEVIITCTFQPQNPKNRLIIISWTGDPDGSFDDEGITFGTFYSNDNHVDISEMYEGKALIESDMNKKESKLILKQVTLRESRRIRCFVQIPGDTVGQTSGLTSLIVLGVAEYGQNINLTCVSEEGSPAPTYQWQNYDVKNVLRPLPPKATAKDGLLSLFNVSVDTSGYYICTSTNQIRSAKCNLTLAVMPPTMNMGATVGIIGGCVAGIAVLVLIIYCCCRDKEKPEEFAMEHPVIDYLDIPNKEKQEDGDVRKISIDQRERYETAEKDSDRNSNRKLDYDDRQEDEHPDRFDDRRDISSGGRNANRRERFDERTYHYNDPQKHYDDRRGQYSDFRDQDDDRQNRSDGRRDGFGDQQDRYTDRGERYDNREDYFDDRRGYYPQNRYNGDRYYSDDRREDYDDRQGRYEHHRHRYGDRQDHNNDQRDRYGRYDRNADRLDQ
ncbi:cell surface A33 antigen isoform 2-T2 [Clarias gariepinus]|uniref:cell surface A33 antigen isoform X2 n=1 Tax=Clarias gariepinus TaxID=13013 RepID=UPI00234D67E5|nr:cell surface A33 antigen isoform X2 [Clarias gariepinus]